MSRYLLTLLVLVTVLAGPAVAEEGIQATKPEAKVIVYRANSDKFRDAWFRVRLNGGEQYKLKRGRQLQLATAQQDNWLTVNDSRRSQINFTAADDVVYLRAQMKKGDNYYLELSLSGREEFERLMKQ